MSYATQAPLEALTDCPVGAFLIPAYAYPFTPFLAKTPRRGTLTKGGFSHA